MAKHAQEMKPNGQTFRVLKTELLMEHKFQILTLQVYELYYRRYQYTSTSCCVDVRDSLLLCHLCTFLSQSTRVEAELQSAECGAFKAKAVLKCRLVHTLSIHTLKF